MAQKKAKKVEAWLTEDEWAIVQAHMNHCYVDSVASYVRQAVLAGLPSQSLRLDGLINDLVLAVNRLSRSNAAGASEEVAAWLPHAKKLARDLQRSRADQRKLWEWGV